MLCKNCGAEIAEGAVFCGNCGMKVDLDQGNTSNTEQPGQQYQQYQPQDTYQPYQPQYDQQNQYQGQYQPQQYGEPAGEDINTIIWIVLSALEIITCCGVIPGIIGLIFGISANSKKNKGDFVGAKADNKKAMICVIVGAALVVVSIVLSLVSGVLTSISNYY